MSRVLASRRSPATTATKPSTLSSPTSAPLAFEPPTPPGSATSGPSCAASNRWLALSSSRQRSKRYRILLRHRLPDLGRLVFDLAGDVASANGPLGLLVLAHGAPLGVHVPPLRVIRITAAPRPAVRVVVGRNRLINLPSAGRRIDPNPPHRPRHVP